MFVRKILMLFALASTIEASAFSLPDGCLQGENYRDLEALRLSAPEMKAALVDLPEKPDLRLGKAPSKTGWKMDLSFFRQRTNPGLKPYKFMDDLTFVGVPLFLGGMAVKADKAMFRVNVNDEDGGKQNTQLLTDFRTRIDDYAQFFGPAMVVGLKLFGYEGRSDWPRLLASAGMSYAIMAGFVNGIKYTAKEMRPDGSTANSWPSGHTATAFVGATLLHKEYGLTRSPWWSVAGYGVATATGVMRVLNNRHWISDVMSGAGIGIMSAELGYALCDLLFKGKGLLRNDLDLESDNPYFFSISMGLGLGGKDLVFEDQSQDQALGLRFRAATVVDAEGAYFFNRYVGVGGRLRVRAQSVKDFNDYAKYVAEENRDAWKGLQPLYETYHPEDYVLPATTEEQLRQNESTYLTKVGYQQSESGWAENAPVTDIYGIVRSNHITEFTGSVGVYFNVPLSRHFSIGTKALIGRSITQELDIDGHAEGNKKDISYTMTLDNRQGMKQPGGDPTLSIDGLMYPNNTGEQWIDDWEYLTVGAKPSTSLGTGISLNYRYKSNFTWRLYCDYDYTRKDFTAKYDPFHFVQKGTTTGASYLMDVAGAYADGLGIQAREYKTRRYMNYVTLGLSLVVNL